MNSTSTAWLLAASLFSPTFAQTASVTPPPAATRTETRTEWFNNARFGLFIHWGVYAVPAGEYKGKPVGWIGEWIMKNASIPVADYRAFAKEFTAANYNPQDWANLAKEAGVKYIVITAKHHDGFSLYDSAVSDWDVAGSSSAGSDLLAPLASAVRAQGLKFGIYYSHAQDWTHPGGAIMGKKAGAPGWDPAQTGDFDTYLRTIAAPQVKEILTRYQPDILWWDTPVNMNRERAQPLHDLLALQPNLITNDRLGGSFAGDTKTPEQHIPPRGYPGEMFEVCMTMNDTWGFKKNDHNWKSSRQILQNLSDISSKGGNFLLNIGPDATGRIPEPSIERLRAVGRWMKVNGESIYGTTASPFPRRLPWGRVTRKTEVSGAATYYLHVWDWPADGRLLLPTLQGEPQSARLLADARRVSTRQTPDGLVVELTGAAPDPDVSVIALRFKTVPAISQPAYVLPGADGSFTLGAFDADTHGSLGGNIFIEGNGPDAILARWSSHEFRVEYQIETPAARKWRVSAEIAAEHPVELKLKQGKTEVSASIPATGPGRTWKTIELGQLALPAGKTSIELVPKKDRWKSIDVKSVRLVPVP